MCREHFLANHLQRKPVVSDSDMHHGTCVAHVPWCMSGSLTRGGMGKRSRHSRRMHNPQFCVSGKRPMGRGMGLFSIYGWAKSQPVRDDVIHVTGQGSRPFIQNKFQVWFYTGRIHNATYLSITASLLLKPESFITSNMQYCCIYGLYLQRIILRELFFSHNWNSFSNVS